jgi:hypothetical protein
MAELERGNPDELCDILSNWLKQAHDPVGHLPEGMTPIEWAVRNFIALWRDPIRDSLDHIDELLSSAIAATNSGEKQEALLHLECIRQSLSEEIRTELGLQPWNT